MLLKASEHRKSSPLFTAAQVLKRWASAELGERAQVRRALKDAGLEDKADSLSAPRSTTPRRLCWSCCWRCRSGSR